MSNEEFCSAFLICRNCTTGFARQCALVAMPVRHRVRDAVPFWIWHRRVARRDSTVRMQLATTETFLKSINRRGSEWHTAQPNAQATWVCRLRGLFHALDPTENEDTHEDLIGNALMGR